MFRLILTLCIILSLTCSVLAQTEKLTGYRNLNWDTPLNSDFTNCTPNELYSLKQDILACKYKYDDKTYGYIDNAYVTYLFYNKKLIGVRIGIVNEILDANVFRFAKISNREDDVIYKLIKEGVEIEGDR